MLAAFSKQVTKAHGLVPAGRMVPAKRSYATKKRFIPANYETPKYSPEQRQRIEKYLAKVNADPKKKKAFKYLANVSRRVIKTRLAFWQKYAPVYGVAIPTSKIQKDVLRATVLSTTESWEELEYAVLSYQSKLQQDEAFYKLHLDLSKDKATSTAAGKAIVQFIKSINTPSQKAKSGLLSLVRAGHFEAIKNGEVHNYMADYIKQFKREVKVDITTAHKLAPVEVEHYTNRIKQLLAGDERVKLILSTKEDASILGGTIMTINGKKIDKSWKREQDDILNSIASLDPL